jgi:hypothetical protein
MPQPAERVRHVVLDPEAVDEPEGCGAEASRRSGRAGSVTLQLHYSYITATLQLPICNGSL